MNSSNRTDAAAPSSDYRSKRRIRILATFGFLSIALIVITVVSAGLGQYNIPTDHVMASLGRRLGMIPKDPTAYLEDSTLWNIRFPRVLLALPWDARARSCRRFSVTRWPSPGLSVCLQAPQWEHV